MEKFFSDTATGDNPVTSKTVGGSALILYIEACADGVPNQSLSWFTVGGVGEFTPTSIKGDGA